MNFKIIIAIHFEIGIENRDALPNPWARRSNNQSGQQQNASNAPPNIMNNPSLQSLMQQMSDNPTLMQNMLNAPYTR